MSDISRIYVAVSSKYIKPGINKMEELALLSKAEYTLRVGGFEKWSNDTVAEIDKLAKEVCIHYLP
jgi:hypothetical protein